MSNGPYEKMKETLDKYRSEGTWVSAGPTRQEEVEALAEKLFCRKVGDDFYDNDQDCADCCFDMATTFIDQRDEWRKEQEL